MKGIPGSTATGGTGIGRYSAKHQENNGCREYRTDACKGDHIEIRTFSCPWQSCRTEDTRVEIDPWASRSWRKRVALSILEKCGLEVSRPGKRDEINRQDEPSYSKNLS